MRGEVRLVPARFPAQLRRQMADVCLFAIDRFALDERQFGLSQRLSNGSKVIAVRYSFLRLRVFVEPHESPVCVVRLLTLIALFIFGAFAQRVDADDLVRLLVVRRVDHELKKTSHRVSPHPKPKTPKTKPSNQNLKPF